MRRLAAILFAALMVAGCGNGNPAVPPICKEGTGVVEKALAKAPGPVRMDGTPISACFSREANGDDVQIVGSILVGVAQQLGDRAAADREGPAAVQLGYLVGAARRGEKRNGTAPEMVRRLGAVGAPLASGSAAYQRGLRAGLAGG
jgi:hypothetical protein